MTAHEFLKEYELQTNTHTFKNVAPLIDEAAVYFFSDSTLQGIKEIEKAFVQTWNSIEEEEYTIKDINWLITTSNMAVCTYTFAWKGTVKGHKSHGSGRGTNIMVSSNGSWKMIHEHLSVVPTDV